MSAVKRTISYRVLGCTLAAAEGHTGRIEFRYDSANPWSVLLAFDETTRDADGGRVAWTVSRDLLAEGLSRQAGLGDVTCWTAGLWYYIALASDEGRITIGLLAEPIRAFLIDAEDLVGYGSEVLDFDAELDALLKDGAR